MHASIKQIKQVYSLQSVTRGTSSEQSFELDYRHGTGMMNAVYQRQYRGSIQVQDPCTVYIYSYTVRCIIPMEVLDRSRAASRKRHFQLTLHDIRWAWCFWRFMRSAWR